MERFNAPPIQAQNWKQAQPKINSVVQSIVRMLNDISTGEGIPTGRIKDGAVTEDKVAALAIVAGKISVVGIDSNGKLVLTEIGSGNLDDIADGTYGKVLLTDITAGRIALNYGDGKIVLGLDGLGAGLDGMVIIDGGAVRRVEIGEVTDGVYSINIRDADGNLVTNQGEVTDRWRLVEDYTFPENAAGVTFNGLHGDADEEYLIHAIWINNGGVDNNYGLQCNADAGNNYGFQTMHSQGDAVSVNAYHNEAFNMLWMGRVQTDHYYSQGWAKLFATSGHIRHLIGQFSAEVHGADIDMFYGMACTWSNTADEITSLKFVCTAGTAIHAGSRVIIYRKIT